MKEQENKSLDLPLAEAQRRRGRKEKKEVLITLISFAFSAPFVPLRELF
jgi:hypothetical protein